MAFEPDTMLGVQHGATGSASRPHDGPGTVVLWIGSATPANAVTNDLWWDTTNLIEKRYNGTTWDVSGSAAYAPIGTGTPSGPAGGGLSGTYPNPDLAANYIVNSMVASGAAIDPAKVALVNDGPFATPSQRTQAYSILTRRRTGRLYMPPGVVRANSTLATVAGLMYLMPILAERPLTVDAFALFWPTAPTAGQIRFGIYADDGQGLPTGAPVADSGLATANTTNATSQTKTLGTPYVAAPGAYWIGFLVCSNITGAPTVTPYSPASEIYGSSLVGGNALYVASLTTTLPTISTVNEIGSELWPAVSYRISAYT